MSSLKRKSGSYDSLDLTQISQRLEGSSGKEFWRGLEELADTEEARAFLEDEFPQRSPEWLNPVNRREALRLLGASLALAGLTGCTRQPPEKIVPYVRQPEEIVYGKPLFFATAMPMSGFGTGLLVESHMGRPTKVEGNPLHPGSLGAADAFAQASALTMWDPDRSRVVVKQGRISNWLGFLVEMNGAREQELLNKRGGLRILTESISSPTFAQQIEVLRKEIPGLQWHVYEPTASGAGAQPYQPVYQFAKANVVLSLDSDFLCNMPGSLRYSREFMARRKLRGAQGSMNRLYVVEPFPSPTGAVADHRLPLRAGDVETFAQALAAQFGAGTATGELPAEASSFLEAAARDLQNSKGASIVVAGPEQPPAVHAAVHAINQALGNVGVTVQYMQPVVANPVNHLDSLWSLVKAINNGEVDTLMIIGGNPVFDAPADMNFQEALQKVKLTAHLSLYFDETSQYCQWHVPQAHYLESWSDVRAFDGTASLIQPLIEPLYNGKTLHEMAASLTTTPDRPSYDIVREYWRGRAGGQDFETFWRTALHDGVVPNTAAQPGEFTAPVAAQQVGQSPAGPSQMEGGLEIVFRPDPTIWDGRFANNGWLQELPKPMSKLTWDNAAYMSPSTAERLGVVNEDVVELKFRSRSVRAPVWVLAGHADESVTVHFGYGRRRAGRIGEGIGFNAYSIRTSLEFWRGTGVEVSRTGDRWGLACTQMHHGLEGRDIVRTVNVPSTGGVEQEHHDEATPIAERSIYPQFNYPGYAWGMSVDQTLCVGCNACVIACQAENNIPIVGKKEVQNGREMHWLRIDRYYQGDPANPQSFFQPMMCQHCEKAPCEPVCPVAATVHSAEGLNQMVYNRCVGTRYCSNNCPYKVRRFNFYLYSDWGAESLYGLRNPEVTVRSRGVMEKCTYCVQRIQYAKIEAEKENRSIRDGEILTACQQSCPTEAIIFGNLNDKNSRVAQLRTLPLSYSVLGDLATEPRTSYIARVLNPNPELKKDNESGNTDSRTGH